LLIFYYFFHTEMLCAGCGRFQCRTKSNILLNKICKTSQFLTTCGCFSTLVRSQKHDLEGWQTSVVHKELHLCWSQFL